MQVNRPHKLSPFRGFRRHRAVEFPPSSQESETDIPGVLERILTAHDESGKSQIRAADCSWQEVFNLMNEASGKEALKTDDRIATTKISVPVLEYIELIPDDNGLCIIKGALALLFESLKRRQENKDKILSVFGKIPDALVTIDVSFVYLDADPGEKKYKDDFLQSLMQDLPTLIKILHGDEPWYKKIASFAALWVSETQTIETILARWEDRLQVLREHCSRMQIRVLSTLKHDISELKSQEKEESFNICQMLTTSRSLQEALMTKFKELEIGFSEQHQEVMMNQTQFTTLLINFPDEFKDMKDRLDLLENKTSIKAQDKLEQGNLDLGAQVGRLPRQRSHVSLGIRQDHRLNPLITQLQLMGILGIGIRRSWDDLDTALRQANSFDTTSQGQAKWLLKTPEFQQWLSSRDTKVLLANGSMNEHLALVSPMSSFCATLILSLQENGHAVVLSYFAGLHCSTEGRGVSGPNGLVRSLCAQLLLSRALVEPELDFLTTTRLEQLSHHDIRALCPLFEELVLQIHPSIPVYCIIDGIWLYEQQPWLQDLKYLAMMFDSLAKRQSAQSSRLKVLMTSPGTSTELIKNAQKRSRVWFQVSLAAGFSDE